MRPATLCLLTVVLLGVIGCGAPAALDHEHEVEMRPLRHPPIRIGRAEEAYLMKRMDDLRSNDYLRRVRAEGEIDALMAGNAVNVAPYLVQMMSEPQLDIRISVVRLFMKHGRNSPDATAILVRVLGDPGLPLSLRDDVAATLRRWTGLDFGYRAWIDPEGVPIAIEAWRRWLEETGGIMGPQVSEEQ